MKEKRTLYFLKIRKISGPFIIFLLLGLVQLFGLKPDDQLKINNEKDIPPAYLLGNFAESSGKILNPGRWALPDKQEKRSASAAPNIGSIKEIKVEEILRAKVGSGPDELGVITPVEANPEGPMSFALSSTGEIYVLDQTNSRIQVFKDGHRIKSIQLPNKSFSDLELLPGGLMALLDSEVEKAVLILDAKGSVVNSISLVQKEIKEPGAVVGIYFKEKGSWPGLWGQMDNSSVLLAGSDIKPSSEFTVLPGLISLNGQRLFKIEFESEKQISILRSSENLKNWTQFRINFMLPLGQVYGLWEDYRGNIYLAINLYDQEKEANEVVVLNPEGKELGRVAMFIPTSPNEIYYPVRITPDGSIYQLAIENHDVIIRRYRIF
ncbi:MAG: hypothetical protein ACPLZD_00070 [Candidatus Saccharicenans sp.]